MRSRANSLAFAAVAALLLFSPIAYRAVMEDAVPLLEISDKTWLEGRALAALGDLDGTSFLDSTFQDGFDKLATDSVPARDELMVGSAYLQKFSIDAAAAPFGYALRHTYFGSEYVVDCDAKVILHQPATVLSTKAQKRRLTSFIDTINEAAREHPETRFVVDQLTMTDQTEESPLYALTSGGDLVDKSYVQESIVDRFDDPVTALCDPIESREEIDTVWFASDHHWTLERAARSYNAIADVLGLEPYEYDEDEAVEISDAWFGSNARSSRNFDCPNTLYDIPTDYSNLSFFELGKDVERGGRIDLGSREKILEGQSVSNSSDSSEGVRSYTGYYGLNPVYIENSGENNGKTCLLVGDSFTHCLKRVIANNYETTLVILPANVNCGIDRSLDSIIDEYDIDDVIVLTHCQKYNDMALRSPSFVGE